MAAVTHSDYAWNRLTRTIDLTGVSAADAPTLRTQLLWDTEAGYDHAVLEAHTAGADDWTTLPEKGGATSTAVPVECEAGYFIKAHPALKRYLTPGSAGCTATGTSGSWNSFTGASDGWQEVSFDLSAYAGKTVEVSLSYITDPGIGRPRCPRRQRLRRHRRHGRRRPRASRRRSAPGASPGRPRAAPRSSTTGACRANSSRRTERSPRVTPCCSASAWSTSPRRPTGRP